MAIGASKRLRWPGRERAVKVAAVGDDPRLVERGPLIRPCRRARWNTIVRVFGEPVGDVAIEPAAAIVERGRKVPVIERGHRADARFAQRVDEAAIEIQPFLIHAAGAFGEDAAPGNAEAIRLQAERLHHSDVLRHSG